MAGGDSFDLTGLGRAAADRPDVHDLLTFLTGDFRPVIRVSRIRQIFVLFELFANRPDQVVRSKAAALLGKSRLTAYFLARDTMPSIKAPLAKSLKYRISFSPLA